MKKKWPWIAIAALVLVSGTLLIFSMSSRPFQSLKSEEIQEAAVRLTPPDIRLAVSKEETEKLAEILRRVVVYRKDDSYKEYAGQYVEFTITKTDGTVTTVAAYNPLLIIDGVGYRTKYGPCEELNHLANNLRAGKEGI